MDSLPSLSSMATWALPAALLAALLLFAMRFRQRGAAASRGGVARESVDTVMGWPPEAARVMTVDERQAFEVLRRAFPNLLVLAQVPLSRFVRVPLRRSYTEWLQRVGTLSADLLLCDPGSRVLAVIDVRTANESERSQRRHERMSRVLRQAGVHVVTWREGALPDVAGARSMLAPLLDPQGTGPKSFASRPMPLIPVAEMEEILAEGDERAASAANAEGADPVPSGYFDDFEVTVAQR